MAAACCVTEPGRNIMGGGCGDKRLCSREWRLYGSVFHQRSCCGFDGKISKPHTSKNCHADQNHRLVGASHGFFRETVATEGTAAMEAIFGHGLVDSGAAAAQIGNLTYALGPDVSLGQDLSQSKLSLPAGMGRDLAN